MELKPNMYVRRIGIFKIITIEDFNSREYKINGSYMNKKDIKKASYNIIDLIEVGDYVNGYKVRGTSVSTLLLDNFNMIQIDEEDIKSIVTKEQFESVQYKVGE